MPFNGSLVNLYENLETLNMNSNNNTLSRHIFYMYYDTKTFPYLNPNMINKKSNLRPTY